MQLQVTSCFSERVLEAELRWEPVLLTNVPLSVQYIAVSVAVTTVIAHYGTLLITNQGLILDNEIDHIAPLRDNAVP